MIASEEGIVPEFSYVLSFCFWLLSMAGEVQHGLVIASEEGKVPCVRLGTINLLLVTSCGR